jgi:hypothetical protein
MMEELRGYMTTTPGRSMLPSSQLQEAINGLPIDLLNTTAGKLSSEETTSVATVMTDVFRKN